MSEDADSAIDHELLVRAELALTQLNNRHGLEPAQSATLTAIRLRLEGIERATLEDLLGPQQVRARGLFDIDAVEGLKREHLSGARTHADRLWTLMMAELWMREYLDQHGLWTLR